MEEKVNKKYGRKKKKYGKKNVEEREIWRKIRKYEIWKKRRRKWKKKKNMGKKKKMKKKIMEKRTNREEKEEEENRKSNVCGREERERKPYGRNRGKMNHVERREGGGRKGGREGEKTNHT